MLVGRWRRVISDSRRRSGKLPRGLGDAGDLAGEGELAKLPKNSSKVRIRNRCSMSGRPRAYIGKFGVSRITFRELALAGKIPGVTKSSW
jgi:small subunit ribosomal protein S14